MLSQKHVLAQEIFGSPEVVVFFSGERVGPGDKTLCHVHVKTDTKLSPDCK